MRLSEVKPTIERIISTLQGNPDAAVRIMGSELERLLRQKITTELFDIVAFQVPNHKSLIYLQFVGREGLHKALDKAMDQGANVVSIRRVVE